MTQKPLTKELIFSTTKKILNRFFVVLGVIFFVLIITIISLWNFFHWGYTMNIYGIAEIENNREILLIEGEFPLSSNSYYVSIVKKGERRAEKIFKNTILCSDDIYREAEVKADGNIVTIYYKDASFSSEEKQEERIKKENIVIKKVQNKKLSSHPVLISINSKDSYGGRKIIYFTDEVK